jgi:hypothetical protein
MIKLRTIRPARRVSGTEQMGNRYNILVRKTEGKRLLARNRRKEENIIKTDHKKEDVRV